jgi:hypothetical protein
MEWATPMYQRMVRIDRNFQIGDFTKNKQTELANRKSLDDASPAEKKT